MASVYTAGSGNLGMNFRMPISKLDKISLELNVIFHFKIKHLFIYKENKTLKNNVLSFKNNDNSLNLLYINILIAK